MTKVINSTKEKAALLDWDGTLRAGYEITEWCDFLDERGNFDREIGERQRTLLSNYLTGKITYSQAVFDVGVNYAEGLGGYKVKDTQDLALQFADNDKAIFDFTPALFEILHRNKIKIILVSNTPQLLLEVYRKKFKLSKVYGLKIAEKADFWVNKVIINPGLTESKKKIAADLAKKYDIILGMGDTHHDVPLFEYSRFRLFIKPRKKPNISIPEVIGLEVVSEDTVLKTIESKLINISTS